MYQKEIIYMGLYKDGGRIGNAGFLKVENRGQESKLDLKLRNIPLNIRGRFPVRIHNGSDWKEINGVSVQEGGGSWEENMADAVQKAQIQVMLPGGYFLEGRTKNAAEISPWMKQDAMNAAPDEAEDFIGPNSTRNMKGEGENTNRPDDRQEGMYGNILRSVRKEMDTGASYSPQEDTTAGGSHDKQEGIEAGKPYERQEGITAGKPYEKQEGITAGKSYEKQEGITARKPYDKQEGIAAGKSYEKQEGIAAGKLYEKQDGITAETAYNVPTGMNMQLSDDGHENMVKGMSCSMSEDVCINMPESPGASQNVHGSAPTADYHKRESRNTDGMYDHGREPQYTPNNIRRNSGTIIITEELPRPAGSEAGSRSNSAPEPSGVYSLKEDKWEQILDSYERIHPYGDERVYVKLEPKDFIILQSKYQHLVNNSFLLHGFYNYRYVILGKENDFYLGVPGVFYEREKMVALMFGFEAFECPGGIAKAGEFGYYLRKVEL